MSFGVNFIQDGHNIVDDIKAGFSGQLVLVIFNDLISSPSLSSIANIFTVDARHMNISMVFLTQRIFVMMNILEKCIKYLIISGSSRVQETHLK